MLEEFPVAGAQVVQSGFAVGSMCKAVFRTFTVAGKEELTFLALAGEGVLFHLSELHLAFAVHHFHQCLFMNVAQLVFRKYKVVAGIYVAVEFHDTGMSASLGHGADARLRTYQLARVESNNWMKKLPTSWRTHSSNKVQRKLPHCSGDTEKSANFSSFCNGLAR